MIYTTDERQRVTAFESDDRESDLFRDLCESGFCTTGELINFGNLYACIEFYDVASMRRYCVDLDDLRQYSERGEVELYYSDATPEDVETALLCA